MCFQDSNYLIYKVQVDVYYHRQLNQMQDPHWVGTNVCSIYENEGADKVHRWYLGSGGCQVVHAGIPV